MKRTYSIMLVILLSLAVIGTAEAKKKHPPKPNPAFPGHPGTHSLILQKVQFSDFDLSRDTTGAVYPTSIEITEDGNLVLPTSGDTTLPGTRGELQLQTPVQWLINYDPSKNYQVILTEQVPVGNTGKRIIVPATPTAGFWPWGQTAGKIAFGKESYLQFVDKTQ